MELGIINLSYMNLGEVIRSSLSFPGVHALHLSEQTVAYLDLEVRGEKMSWFPPQ